MSSKFVIVDEIMGMLESVKSGVVPGSVTQSVVSGIQNVPSNIIQQKVGAGSSSSAYTTVPLSPIIKCCNLDKTYLYLEFDINCGLVISSPAEGTIPALVDGKIYKIPLYLGFRDNASIFNQLQLLVENTAIWQTVYQRQESVISYNSLPETEIRGNNQYSSIDKMVNNEYSPMKRIIIDFTAKNNQEKTVTANINLHFKGTVDINRLSPILSNLSWTTPHMGNLRLKLFLQNIQEALFFCPDYSWMGQYKGKGNDAIGSSAVEVERALNSQPFYNKYFSFYPLGEYFDKFISSAQIPLFAYIDKLTDQELTDKKLISTVVQIPKYKFTNPPNNLNFMTFEGGTFEIVQTNFDIKDEEYQRLTDYFASMGSIIIPSQTVTTNVFNNSDVANGQLLNGSMIGNIGGYNINNISVWACPKSQPTYLQKEFLTGIQLILDGRPINPLPYSYINDKCVVDCTQAIIDTDHEEINKDYIRSLTFLNETDDQNYVSASPHELYGTGLIGSSIHKGILANPGTFCLNFSTNLPDAFHSGACIIENSNRQAVLRFNSTAVNKQNPINTNTQNGKEREKFPCFINTVSNGIDGADTSHSTITGFTSFCDVCIVLNYDVARGICYDGQLSWAAPYL